VAGGRREQQRSRPATTEKEPWNNMSKYYFIYVTEELVTTYDAADIALDGERAVGVTSIEDAVLEAAEDYLLGRRDVEEVRVWVLAPDKKIHSYVVKAEITFSAYRF
jgi:hypothetical protein